PAFQRSQPCPIDFPLAAELGPRAISLVLVTRRPAMRVSGMQMAGETGSPELAPERLPIMSVALAALQAQSADDSLNHAGGAPFAVSSRTPGNLDWSGSRSAGRHRSGQISR